MKTKSLIILIFGLIFSILIICFIYWFQYVKPVSPTPAQKPVSVPEITPISSPCLKFLETGEEITCGKIIGLSLKEYSGDIEYVDKVILPEEEILWEVGVKLDKPTKIKNLPQEMERIKIIIDAKTSEIISVRPGREI